MTWQTGTLVRERYLIEEMLGTGGFGATYLALDKRLGRRVVLKTPNDEKRKDPEYSYYVKAFIEEARILASLGQKRHQHIVQIMDLLGEGDLPFLVMEYIEGESLYQRVKRQRKGVPEQDAVRWIRQIGSALHCAHTSFTDPIIHRDAHPGNIMIPKDDCAILIDFGIARKVQPNATPAAHPIFASWEQFMGTTHVTLDVYTLAASLYFAVTGKEPISSALRQFNGKVLVEPTVLCPGLNQSLNSVILKGMELDPGSRPQTIEAFLALLNASVSKPTPMVPLAPQQANPKLNPPSVDWLSGILGQVPGAKKEAVSPNQPPKNLPNSFWFETVTLDKNGRIIDRKTYEAEQFTEDLGNGTKIELVKIPGGNFLMGSPANEAQRSSTEVPQHRVQVPSFLMGKYAVTQAQWRRVSALSKVKIDLRADPSHFKGSNRPVERVSWDEATEFCARLSRATNRAYRLPSESEWEYTCRAGTDSPFSFGPTLSPDVANYHGNYVYGQGSKGKYRQETTDVGSFPANSFGLYDMHGNVWEWCQDWWHDDYSKAPSNGIAQLNQQSDELYRLLRGGSWFLDPRFCRCAYRHRPSPDSRDFGIGFRVACSLAS